MKNQSIFSSFNLFTFLIFNIIYIADCAFAAGSLSVHLHDNSQKVVVSLKAPANLVCSGSLLLTGTSRPASSTVRTKTQNFPVISSSSSTRLSVVNIRKIRSRSSQSAYFKAIYNCNDGRRYTKSTRLLLSLTSSKSGYSSIGQWLNKVRNGLTIEIAKLLVTPTPTPTPGATPTLAPFPPASLSLVKAFPNISFSSPIDLRDAKDGSSRLFVAEQGGKIYSFENKANSAKKNLFIDISGRIKSGGEQGLLGLAFHPDFASNGYFFVNYTRAGDGATVIARYTAQGSQANSNTELIFLTVAQPFDNHNGGALQFGPDGFLYIGLGDGGSGGDPQGNGQKLSTDLGKILRIDVNTSADGNNFSIPSDNPFKNSSGARPEIFAYGFRNPWRMSFDSANGRLWVADVGQGNREEVDLVSAGGNYGWNTMEGFACYPENTSCSRAGLQLPVADYNHSLGQSITGGYVYHGSAVPALSGVYLYADFISGRLWGIRSLSPLENSVLINSTNLLISSFGIDRNGEVYVVDYGGSIYKFQG